MSSAASGATSPASLSSSSPSSSFLSDKWSWISGTAVAAAASAAAAYCYYSYKMRKAGSLSRYRNLFTSSSPSSTPSCCAPPVSKSVTIASSSGKVLLIGGYLVLEHPNIGIVASADARIHTAISKLSSEDIQIISDEFPSLSSVLLPRKSSGSSSSSSSQLASFPVVILCPQRLSAPLVYRVSIDLSSSSLSLSQESEFQERNKFLYYSLSNFFNVMLFFFDAANVANTFGDGLLLRIEADFPFYTADMNTVMEEKARELREKKEAKVTGTKQGRLLIEGKTGLGSSAALVTSVMSALFTTIDWIPKQFSVVKQYKENEHVEADLLFNLPSSLISVPDGEHADSASTLRLSLSARMSLCYRLCQLSHCLAQGKVGSGFDVSSALLGSQTYIRFSQSILQTLMEHLIQSPHQVCREFLVQRLLPEIIQFKEDPITLNKLLKTPQAEVAANAASSASAGTALNDTPISFLDCWDDVDSPFTLPPGFHLLLADVSGGAHTPTLVSAVLKWRAALQDSDESNVWTRLRDANVNLAALLKEITVMAAADPDEYAAALRVSAHLPAGRWAAAAQSANPARQRILYSFSTLFSAFRAVRLLFRQLGEAASAPLEPEDQKRLIDFSLSKDGVVAAGVPGAGGNDAVFVVVLAEDRELQSVEERMNEAWRVEFAKKFPEDKRRIQLLPVRAEHGGLLVESGQMHLEALLDVDEPALIASA